MRLDAHISHAFDVHGGKIVLGWRVGSLSARKNKRLTSSQTVEGAFDTCCVLCGLSCNHDAIVASDGTERTDEACFVYSPGNAGGAARKGFHDDHIAGSVDFFNQFGNHALQAHIFGKNVESFPRLEQAHVGDIARNGSLRTIMTRFLELFGQIALRADIALANNVANDIMPLCALLHSLMGSSLFAVSYKQKLDTDVMQKICTFSPQHADILAD